MSDTLQFPSIQVRGFNITPGTAWLDEDGDQVWIATTKVTRDANNEVVHVVARAGVWPENYMGPGRPPRGYRPTSFTFDYCDKIKVIGAVVNPNDEDDNDFGADAAPVAVDLIRALPQMEAMQDPRYENALETAISLITHGGFSPEHPDTVGDPMEDTVQSLLMEAFCRAPGIEHYLSDVLRKPHVAGPSGYAIV